MTRIRWLWAARQLVADQMLRVRGALADLAARIRDEIAATVGDAMSAVARVLLERTGRQRPHRTNDWGRGDFADPHDSDWASEDEPHQQYASSRRESAPPAGRTTGWVRTLLYTLLAAGPRVPVWPNCDPMMTVLGIALATGLAATIWPPLAAFVVLAGSATRIVTLIDGAATEAGDLAEAVRP